MDCVEGIVMEDAAGDLSKAEGLQAKKQTGQGKVQVMSVKTDRWQVEIDTVEGGDMTESSECNVTGQEHREAV